MSWQKRKQLCLSLLEETSDIISKDDDMSDINEMCGMYLDDLKHVFDIDYKEMSEEEKEVDSIKKLIDVCQFVYANVSDFFEVNYPQLQPPTYMTQKQAKEKLIKDYFESLKGEGDTHFLNIEQWLDANHIVIIDENQSSSCKEKAEV